MPTFDFRPLTPDDLPRLHRWRNAAHVAPWFGGPVSLDALRDEYAPVFAGSDPCHPFVASIDGRPVGLFTHTRFGDWPQSLAFYGNPEADAGNCDVLIGEAEVAQRGVGAAMIRAFLERVLFADPRITTCIIDPVPDNAIAIRAYEKAGFRFVRALPDDGEGNGLYLLELRRDELHQPFPPAPFYLRPAHPSELDIARDIDDDACTLYAEAGLTFGGDDAPLAVREQRLWAEAAARARLLFACAPDGTPVGFVALGHVDGHPYVEQLSVRCAWMRRGVGRALLTRAKHWSVHEGELWLATYNHLPWNAPFYAREGFALVPEHAWGPEQAEIMAIDRRELPSPEARVVMRYPHRGG